MSQRRLTACPFCSVADDASTIGAHLDSFIPEISSDKRSCPVHPVALIRAIRSDNHRLKTTIPWKHPKRPTRFVHVLYGKVMTAVTDKNLIPDPSYRTTVGKVDAEWWMELVDAVVEAYTTGAGAKQNGASSGIWPRPGASSVSNGAVRRVSR